MTDSVMQQFAQMLAAEENPTERERLLRRAKLLALNAAKPEAFEPPVSTLGEYLDTAIEVPPSLVWPTIVVRGEITATLGRAGKGKTTVNLCRIVRWAAGRPLFEGFRHPDTKEHYLAPPVPVRTLIIENEGNAGMFHHKVGTLINNCGDKLNDDDRKLIRENVMIWGDGGYSGLKLDDPTMLGNVRAGVEKHKPDIVFVEPFRSLWKGEENSSTDMAAVIDNLIGLATDYGCGVILSHHERKSGAGDDGELMSAGRGSTVLEGAAAVMENFQIAKGGDYREMTWSKARYLPPPPVARMQYDPSSGWYDFIALDQLGQEIIAAIESADEGAMSIPQLMEVTGEKRHRVDREIRELTANGRLKVASESATRNTGGGSTGVRYRVPYNEGDNGGLAI